MAQRNILSRAPRRKVDQSGVPQVTPNDPASGVTTGETVTLGAQPGDTAAPASTPAPVPPSS